MMFRSLCGCLGALWILHVWTTGGAAVGAWVVLLVVGIASVIDGAVLLARKWRTTPRPPRGAA